MAEEDGAGAEGPRDCRLAAQDVGFVVGERDGVEIGVRPGVIAERGAVIEPELEDGLQAGVAEFLRAAGVDEADHWDAA